MLQTIRLLLVLYCLLLVQTGAVYAQEYAVRLKNGTVVRGMLENDTTSAVVLLRLEGGALLRFDKSEIDTVGVAGSFSLIKVQGAPVDDILPYRIKVNGFYVNSMSGLAFTSNNFGNTSVRPVIQASTGIRIKKEVAIGLGAGLGGFAPFGGMLQTFGEVRGSLGRRKSAIHYFGQGGYGLPTNRNWNVETFQGGLYFQAGGGFIFRSFKGGELYLAGGFQQQHAYLRYTTWEPWGGGSAVVSGDRIFRQILWQVGIML